MAGFLGFQGRSWVVLALPAIFAVCALAASSVGQLSVPEIEDALQVSAVCGDPHYASQWFNAPWLNERSNVHLSKSSTYTNAQQPRKCQDMLLRSSKSCSLESLSRDFQVLPSMRSSLLYIYPALQVSTKAEVPAGQWTELAI